MNIEILRNYCLSKPGATEDFPFDETTLVFKVMGKMFALTALEDEPAVNLKCNPDKCLELREQYESVVPGYHMNKKYWNTVYLEGDIPENELTQWIDHSYDLVVSKLTKKQKEALKNEKESTNH